jgi:hypothetical protein
MWFNELTNEKRDKYHECLKTEDGCHFSQYQIVGLCLCAGSYEHGGYWCRD